MTAYDFVLVASQFIGPIVGVVVAHAMARKAAKMDEADRALHGMYKDWVNFQKAFVQRLMYPGTAHELQVIAALASIEADKMMLRMVFDRKASGLIGILAKATKPPQIEDMAKISTHFSSASTEIDNEIQQLRVSVKAEVWDE